METPPIEFKVGQRVQVVGDPLWPASPIGIVSLPPDYAKKVFPAWGEEFRAYERKGKATRAYWVTFDTPQSDGSDDGPYSAGEVDEDCLVLI